MAATAADLPIELYPLILAYVDTDAVGRQNLLRNRACHDLAACSLVCLDWAFSCRLDLFRNGLWIRSEGDLASILRFKRRPSRLPWVITLAHNLYVRQDWTSASWIHRMSTLANDKEFRQNIRYCHLILAGSLSGHEHDTSLVQRCGSFHWSLPRTVPLSFLPTIASLTLKNVRLHSLSSIGKVIRGIRPPATIQFDHVTWGISEIIQCHVYAVQEGTTDYRSIGVEGCTDNMVLCLQAYSALVSTLCPWKYPTRYIRLAQNDVDVLYEMLMKMHEGADRVEIRDFGCNYPTHTIFWWQIRTIGQIGQLQGHIKVEILGIWPRASVDQQAIPGYSGRIQGIMISFGPIRSRSNNPETSFKPDWIPFLKSINQLRGLRAVVFLAESQEFLTLLINGVARVVQSPSTRITYRYAYERQHQSQSGRESYYWAEVMRDDLNTVLQEWEVPGDMLKEYL